MFQRTIGINSGSDPNENLRKLSLSYLNEDASFSAYGGAEFNASGLKTLTIGSISLSGTPTGSDNYIRLYRNNGSTVVKTFTPSRNPQSVDISSYNETLKLRIFYHFSSSYKGVYLNEIELK